MKTIIVATDLGKAGQRAADLAVCVADQTHARLHLVHVQDKVEDVWTHIPEGVHEAAETMRRELESRVARAQAILEDERIRLTQRGLEVSVALCNGRPWEAIIEQANEQHAELIVLGPHTRHGEIAPHPKLLGTNADRVVRHAHCSVLVAGTDEPPSTLKGAHWFVGVDFSAQSQAACATAIDMSRLAGGKVTLAHVLSILAETYDGTTLIGSSAIFMDQMRETSERELAALVKQAPQGVAVNTHVTLGVADLVLCEAAEQQGATLLVVGTHGRKGLGRLIFGSVTEKCLKRTHLPMWIVRAPDEQAP